ncbi:hypothetical protein OBBRIDRAFT_798573 [Obba rivulosa]|uniref:Uncharacterized protein n=1 Tax=Obba rivulosa TaxID=1052685 RepID=A0A8E2AKI9_9APHY|nr:hypothetical protein OBBRIDRAFT_798573 [Obba rivulosa]
MVERNEGARISESLQQDCIRTADCCYVARYKAPVLLCKPSPTVLHLLASTRVVVCQRANNLPRVVQHSGFTKLRARTWLPTGLSMYPHLSSFGYSIFYVINTSSRNLLCIRLWIRRKCAWLSAVSRA